MSSFKPDMNKLLEQASQAEAKMSEISATGNAGAGLVSVTLNGKHECIEVKLDDGLLQESKSTLETLIAAAINDASGRIKQNMQQQLLNLGQLFGQKA